MKTRLEEFGDLSPAEKILRDAVERGVWARISGGVPDEPKPGVAIRASFVRYLALGGCDACRPAAPGVLVEGAYIEGDGDPARGTSGLDLDGAELCGDLYLVACHIPDPVRAYGARGKTLAFGRSRLVAGLEADRLQTMGNVSLRQAEITGKVRLPGAHLDGDLDCFLTKLRSGEFETGFFADNLQTTGSVFLRQAEITGEVSLNGARIGGSLDCDGAKLFAEPPARALDANSLQADGGFFFRRSAGLDGVLDLTEARVAAIADDPASWPAPGNLVLDRFRYDAIPDGPVDAKRRLKWLALQDPSRFGKDFWPQPYEQLAKVFREMGHTDDARRVLVEKEKLLRADQRRRFIADRNWFRAGLSWIGDWFLWAVLAYGQRPLRALVWLFVFWAIGLGVFAFAAHREALKPNNAFVLRAPEWAACDPDYVRQTGGPPVRWSGAHSSQLACFLDQPEAAGYPIFNPFFYSADTLLPIVDLELQTYWIPDERHAPWTRYFLWVQIAVGWALSLLAVAGFSGLVKSD